MVQRIAMAPQGPEFSRFVMGYWRLMDWKMSPGELVSFIEQHLDLGVPPSITPISMAIISVRPPLAKR
jgi:predicted oxidoreductase